MYDREYTPEWIISLCKADIELEIRRRQDENIQLRQSKKSLAVIMMCR